MIRVMRVRLPDDLSDELGERTRKIVHQGSDKIEAGRLWANARSCRGKLKSALQGMAAGTNRCMYCNDSEGTGVDHFDPVVRSPRRTFDWLNHLLACSHCNSHAKRDQFPVDDGSPLLIDPSHDDPLEHLDLSFSDGAYLALTTKGRKSIEVFDLNRFVLCQGRADAFVEARILLALYAKQIETGETSKAALTRGLLERRPHADVLAMMTYKRGMPGAELVFGGSEVLEALALLTVSPHRE